MKIPLCLKEQLNTLLICGILVVGWTCFIQAREDSSGRARKKDVYQELFENAIMRSDLPQIDRLMKRHSKMSLKRFEDVVGWAGDIAEIRRALLPSRMESTGLVLTFLSSLAGVLGGGLYLMGQCDFDDDGPLEKIGEKNFKRILFGGLVSFPLCFALVYYRTKSRYTHSLEMKNKVTDLVKEMKQKNAEASLNAAKAS